MRISTLGIKSFLLCAIGCFLVSCADKAKENNETNNNEPPPMDAMPGSDQDANTFMNDPNKEQLPTEDQVMGELQACVETDPEYLICRFNESLKVTESANPRKDIEQHICTKAGKKNVIVILTEYFYPSVTPKDALVCSISVDGAVSGFAHFTQDFCRNNNKINNKADSLNELLNYYQSNEMGYTCTKR